MPAGSFSVILHGHLPWVLHHGRWPHGQAWLHEAVAEVWLPLLGVVDALGEASVDCPLTLGLTPVLLSQLADPAFPDRFRSYLAGRRLRAQADAVEFAGWGDQHLVGLAETWDERFAELQRRFDAVNGDLPAAIAQRAAQGRLELMASAATHAYLPLLRQDASCRAHIELGLDTTESILGQRPKGFWLPECAFRAGGSWSSPVLPGERVERLGLDTMLARAGVDWTVIDAPLLGGARCEGVVDQGRFVKTGWDQPEHDERGWRSPLELHRISSAGDGEGVVALSRHPGVSEQVWSARVGYPGDGRYLEFHKKHGGDGLRYWRVTSARASLGDKARYEPEQVPGVVYSQAQHFATVVRSVLEQHRDTSGRAGVVVAPFDAELFGHWWHEGLRWLQDVLLTLAAEPAVTLRSASGAVGAHGPDKVVALPEGSWGEGSDHRTWLAPDTKWMWEVIHRSEDRFAQLREEQAGAGAQVREALIQAGRELLLMQASDWPFAVTRGGAADYGFKRFSGHASRFDGLCDLASDLAAGRSPDAVQQATLAEALAADGLFGELSLEHWSG